MRAISTKRARALVDRRRLEDAVRSRDGYRCRARGVFSPDPQWPARCNGDLQIHELIRRSQWRAGWLVLENCILLCNAHHAFVTHHPEEGHRLHLVRWSWERPTDLTTVTSFADGGTA